MAGVCNQCGLPEDLCVCGVIVKEQQKIQVVIEKKKFGKKYTIIRGFEKEVNIVELAKKLKAKFACGGTGKEGRVELQGNHKSRIRSALIELGFPNETIEIR